MDLTDKGAKNATAGAPEKEALAGRLIRGEESIEEFTRGVCFDAAVYVRYLLSAPITSDQLQNLNGQQWVSVLNFTAGNEWDGTSAIPAGRAVGFFRIPDQKIFHAAISVGGTSIRAVNGLRLGNGWQTANLGAVLSKRNSDGTFDYDGTQIRVYISSV